MIKFTLTTLVATFALFTSEIRAEAFSVNSQITLKQTSDVDGIQFDVSSSDEALGTVLQNSWKRQITYDYKDPSGTLLATGSWRLLSSGPVFEITDGNGNIIGSSEEKFFNFFQAFDLFSKNDAMIARASQNLLGTSFSILDPKTKSPIAELNRPFFRKNDAWTALILDPNYFNDEQIDPRAFILVMAMHSDEKSHKKLKKLTKNYYKASFIAFNDQASVDVDPEPLYEKLEQVSPIVENVEPTEEDFVFIVNFLDQYKVNLTLNEGATKQEILENALDQILPLFYKDALTLGQKAALYHILHGMITAFAEE